MSRPAPAAALLVMFVLWPATGQAQDWRTVTSMRQYRGEEHLEVSVEYGAGHLVVEPAPEGLLYRAHIRYDAEMFDPDLSYRSGRLDVGIESGGAVRLRGHSGGRLELGLGTDAPVDLEMAFGAVEADLELGGLRLRDVRISTGASETTLRFSRPNRRRARAIELKVGAADFRAYGLGNANADRVRVEGGVGSLLLDFTGEWRGEMRADLKVGVGSVTVRLPRGLGVRVQRDSFLAGFDGQELTRRGNSYYSENWDTAEHRLSIGIEAAFSSVDIRWVDGMTARR